MKSAEPRSSPGVSPDGRHRPPLNKKRAGFAVESELAGMGGQVVPFPRRALAR